jgi:hypothetical protein
MKPLNRSLSQSRLALGALLALVGFVVAGCSLTTLAYRNAVPLASWYVDDYVDLSRAQEKRFRDGLNGQLAWHRASELPQYTRMLDAAAKRIESPVSAQDVQQLYDDGRRLLQRTGEHALSDLADVLMTLDADQIGQIEQKFAKDNAKFERERLRQAPNRRVRDRAERHVKALEQWLGNLTDEQKQYVEQAMITVPLSDEMRIADRRRLQGEFVALLRAKPQKPAFVERLRTLMLNQEAGRSAEYQADIVRWRKDNAAMIAWVLNHATQKQRVTLQRKLRGFSAEFAALTTAA